MTEFHLKLDLSLANCCSIAVPTAVASHPASLTHSIALHTNPLPLDGEVPHNSIIAKKTEERIHFAEHFADKKYSTRSFETATLSKAGMHDSAAR